jgi:hypothetical protein
MPQKLVTIALIIAAIILFNYKDVLAQEDVVPTDCSTIENANQKSICETAKSLNTPLYVTTTVIFYVQLKQSIKDCKFKSTESFTKFESDLMDYPVTSSIYTALVDSNYISPDFQTSPEQCAELYEYYKTQRYQKIPFID